MHVDCSSSFDFFEVVPYYLLQLVDNVYKALPLTFRHTELNLPQKAPFVSSLIFWVIFNYFLSWILTWH